MIYSIGMKSQKIRRAFLNYFKKNGHTQIPSSPVVPADDPTLLFTNAGMNQFKDVFLGKSSRDYTKATTSQKCVRVGGKHNDLENVGHTTRHLTFFEMLGNFSFGDYFKEEAIAFAWEVSTEIFHFDPKFLWVTVFYEDEESFELWQKFVSKERIVRKGEKDNFWSMGEVGPCGPCSELFYDRGEKFGPARTPAEDIKEERYIEFWNLVFMEFNRDLTGELYPLPKKGVDTGAGLERILSLGLGADSLFETDILMGLIREVEKISGKKYEDSAPFRVIADHLRTLAFAISDGVQPSNIERGYVLRKVLRRAVRYGRQLNLEKPFLAHLVPPLVSMMGDDFPELKSAKSRIEEILTLEEESFLRTLKRGGNILNQVIEKSEKDHVISGDDAFKLKDTYGLPLEEILLLAKDAQLGVDIKRFEELEHEAKERSKASRKTTQQVVEESIFEQFGESEFVGYQTLTTESVIVGLVRDNQSIDVLNEGEEGIVILDRSPFYAEKGGQVGDQGILFNAETQFSVIDTQSPFTGVITHIGVLLKGSLKIGDCITANIDQERRTKIARHHTATHLLHWALQQILGEHVKQSGSIVEAKKLRFDFSHHKSLTDNEIKKIEDLINEKVRENQRVENYEMSFSQAQKRGEIKQFFGEKYGSVVRVVDIDYSKELCGGTHVSSVGEIGYFRITKEGSIASGIRRIEAVTGFEAEQFARQSEDLIKQICEKLKVQSPQIVEKLEKMEEERLILNSQIKALKSSVLREKVQELIHNIKRGKIPFLIHSLHCSSQELKDLADALMQEEPSLVLFLIGSEEKKCTLLARVSDDLVGRKMHAGELIKEIAPLLEGKGGGKADSAQGGGRALHKIPEAMQRAEEWILSKNA